MALFEPFSGIAASLPMSDVDTDMIVPQRFLRRSRTVGFSDALFFNLRDTGEPFVLDVPPFGQAQILLAGANFGTGSSREHAVWALADFGFRAIVAPSFADIFQANCVNNGLLPARLDAAAVALLVEAVQQGDPTVSIDLAAGNIANSTAGSFQFDVAETDRRRLLTGADSIALTLGYAEHIDAHEDRTRRLRPWLETEILPS